MQPFLGAPDNSRDLRWKRLLESSLAQAEVRTVALVPGGFDQNAAKVSVSGLGDGAAATPGPARTFRGHEARVAHDSVARSKRRKVPNSVVRVMAVILATPRKG